MSCKLYFIRHGQSLGNLEGVFLGHTDLDLSPLGYEQAKKSAKYLSRMHIDKVYSSDLQRAYSTCCEYLKISGKSAEKCTGLREIFAGDWENHSFTDLQTIFSESYNVWLTDIGNAKPQNGESVEELTKRAVKTVSEIAEKNDGKTVAVFTHAAFIRSLFNYCYGNGLDSMKDLPWSTNASVSSLEYENGSFKVLNYSVDEFLSDLKTKFPANV